jgi:hypothetical protein
MLGMGLPYVAAFITNGLLLALMGAVLVGVPVYVAIRVIRTRQATKEYTPEPTENSTGRREVHSHWQRGLTDRYKGKPFTG